MSHKKPIHDALDWRPRGLGFKPHRRHWVVFLSKNINPSLVLVQPRKTRPYITKRLLMDIKNQMKQTNNEALDLMYISVFRLNWTPVTR